MSGKTEEREEKTWKAEKVRNACRKCKKRKKEMRKEEILKKKERSDGSKDKMKGAT